MDCEDIIEVAYSGESGVIDDCDREFMLEHVKHCTDCQDALRGVESMRFLKNQSVENPDLELFGKITREVTGNAEPTRKKNSGFWLGAGLGGAVAAAIITAVVALGILQSPLVSQSTTAEFLVSTTEPRDLNIAIDANTDLSDATVSITFFGGIELAGYASQRHLSWTTDLDAGVNKLSLPVIALDQGGGQVIVRLDHPDSQQEFMVQLRHGG